MNNKLNLIKIIALIAVVVVVGFVIGTWGGKRGTTPPQQAVLPGTEPSTATPTTPTPRHEVSRPSALATGTQAVPPAAAPAAVEAAESTPLNVITNWEEKVEEILGTDEPEAVKAKQMLEIFPRLTAEGQTEAAQHLANLTEDQDFAPLGAILTDAAMPEEVLEVIMADLMNRPNTVKLPLLLEVAKLEAHPNAEEARDLLELFLEEDYGTDWAQWQSQIQVWLQENPD